MNHPKSITRGAHHVGLTVPDLLPAQDFFIETLGFQKLGDVPDYPAVFVSDGVTMITLWQAADPATAVPFDRKNVVGLHHLALLVDDHAALDDLHERLAAGSDADVEFAPEPLGQGNAKHMMTTIPGGIRVEFFSPGASAIS